MIVRNGIVAALAMLAGGGALAAEQLAPGQPASIAFARQNIRDWRADGDKGIWVQAAGNAWYYGAFSYPCQGLQFRNAVRFSFGATGELDRWGGVQTRQSGKCLFKSFDTSAGPPAPGKPAQAPAAPTPAGKTAPSGQG